MMRIVAIDSGTTNTKVWVVTDGQVVAEAHGRGGAGDVARGQPRSWLAKRIRSVANEALAEAKLDWSDIDAAVGFGMLTSEHGLEEVPHLVAPVGVTQLVQGLRQRDHDDTIPAPFYLIPGVLCSDPADRTDPDFMRGEETNVVGLLELGRTKPPFLYVSPGSHTKFVAVGQFGQIEWSFTTLSGELIWALSQHTILSPILDPSLPLTDTNAAELGAQVARHAGLSRALYSTRLASRLSGFNEASCTDFARGAVAASDIDGLRTVPELPPTVIIGAGSELGPFYHRFLTEESWATKVEETSEPLGPLGAWTVYSLRQRNARGIA